MKTWHVPCNSLAGAHQYLYWCVYLYSAMPGACPKGVATPEGRFSSDYYITIDRAFAYLPSGLDGRNHLHSNNTAIHITFSGLLARNSGLVVLNIQAAYSGFYFLPTLNRCYLPNPTNNFKFLLFSFLGRQYNLWVLNCIV